MNTCLTIIQKLKYFRDYDLDYDSKKKVVKYESDKFIFVEEAKEFVRLLQAMKSHPIKPSAEIFRVELESDIAEFSNLIATEDNIDAEILQMVPKKSKVVVESMFEECESNAASDCPSWEDWGEWSECKAVLSKIRHIAYPYLYTIFTAYPYTYTDVCIYAEIHPDTQI